MHRPITTAIAAVMALGTATPGGARSRRPAPAPAPTIAITFDDIPAHGDLPPGETRATVMKRLVFALTAGGVPAYGFLNATFGAGDPHAAEAIGIWRAAGLPIGNHGFQHRNLDTLDPAGFAEQLRRNEPAVDSAMGGPAPRWFRYPFLSEGGSDALRDAARAILAERRYRVAAVTMSFGDFLYNAPYARCMAANDAAGVKALEASWMDAARAEALLRRQQARAVYRRDVPQVLLMHVGAFDAHMMARLVALYRALGFRFVTLEKAEADPFYAAATDLRQPGPTPTLDRAALQAGLPPVPRPDQRFLETLCK